MRFPESGRDKDGPTAEWGEGGRLSFHIDPEANSSESENMSPEYLYLY